MDEFFRQQATFKDPVALSWWPNRLYELGLLKGISKGQPVSPAMVSIAKKLRRDMTPEERLLWNEVRGNRVRGLHFRRQQIIGTYVFDFFCETANLAIELDGAGHLLSVEEDALRDKNLRARGIEVIRIANHEVRNSLAAVVMRISDFASSGRKT